MEQQHKDSISLSQQKAMNCVREIGQLRRAKLHASCLLECVNNKKLQNPALRELLEASIILQTKSTKVLAAYLHRSPTIIRAQFQQIIDILGDITVDNHQHAQC